MTAEDSRIPWRWVLPDLPDHQGPPWPPDEQAAVFTDPEAFVEAGSCNISVLVVVGWRTGAARWLYADSRLRSRDILWLMRAGHLRQAAAEVETAGGTAASLTVGVYRDAGMLAPLARYAGLIWGLAVLDDDPAVVARMHSARVDLQFASQFKIDRIIDDLPLIAASVDRAQHALPMAGLHHHCSGRSALCVAAGPGLDDHMEMLLRAQDSCVVIACDVVAARLEAAGIRVDAVVNVDSHQEVAQRVGRLRNRSALLVASLGVHQELANAFDHITYGEQTFGGRFVFRNGADFIRGTNVGTACLGFASFLGCSEILLAGYDLSFTRERTYSRLVTDAERLGEFNFAESFAGGKGYEVPGNDGGMVQTDMCFAMGIDELALSIVRIPKVTVYNLNLTTGKGARIPGTQRLPDGWQPQPGPSPALAMPAPSRDDLLCTDAAAFRRTVLSAWDAWCDRARSCTSRDPITLHRESEFDAVLAPGWELARHAFAGHFQLAARWAAQPSHAARLGMREAIFASIIEALPAIGQVFATALEGRFTPPPAPADAGWDAFRAEFIRVLPVLPQESFAGAAAQFGTLQFAALLTLVPDVPLPPPLSVHDAVLRHASCGLRRGASGSEEVAVSCWLDSDIAGYLLEVLRRHQRLPAEAFCDIERPWGTSIAMRAAQALAKLPAAAPAGLLELARTAAAWIPVRNRLLERLLPLTGGPQVACRLIEEGTLPVDDGTAAELLAGHPDPLSAISVLEPFQDRLGAGTTVAMARRHLGLREFLQAEALAARVPALDAMAEEALGIRLAAVLARSGSEAMVVAAAGFPRPSLRIPGLFLAIRHLAGEGAAWSFLADNHLLPVPPRLIASSLRNLAIGGWKPADPKSAGRMLGLLAEASVKTAAPAEWAADYRTLVAAVQTMYPEEPPR